jgi:DNA-directed RNA polymerase specialized sigma24 family protein
MAFGDWMGRVERPIRLSLFRFARSVEPEAVLQETLMRMWLLAQEARELTGPGASLRFAIGMARNIARSEARRRGREVPLPADDDLEPTPPEPPADPGLARAIRDCLGRLTGQAAKAIRARIEDGHRLSDRALAQLLGMTTNTLLQNIVRARRKIADCLEGKGIPREDFIG